MPKRREMRTQNGIEIAIEGVLRDVLGNVDEDGAGPAGGRDIVRLLDDPGDVVGILDEVVVFHHGHRDAEDVSFLEGVLAEHPGDLLTAEDHHGHRIHRSGHETRDRVSGTGAGGHQNGGGLASGPGITVRHVDGPLFVAHEDELHARLDRLQRVEDGESRPTRVTENILDSEAIEGLEERLGAVEFLCCHEVCLSRGKVLLGSEKSS